MTLFTSRLIESQQEVVRCRSSMPIIGLNLDKVQLASYWYYIQKCKYRGMAQATIKAT